MGRTQRKICWRSRQIWPRNLEDSASMCLEQASWCSRTKRSFTARWRWSFSSLRIIARTRKTWLWRNIPSAFMEQGNISRLCHYVRTRPHCPMVVITSGTKIMRYYYNWNFRRPKNEILSSIKKVDTVQIHQIHPQARKFSDHVTNHHVMHRPVLPPKQVWGLKQVKVHVRVHRAQVQQLPHLLLWWKLYKRLRLQHVQQRLLRKVHKLSKLKNDRYLERFRLKMDQWLSKQYFQLEHWPRSHLCLSKQLRAFYGAM